MHFDDVAARLVCLLSYRIHEQISNTSVRLLDISSEDAEFLSLTSSMSCKFFYIATFEITVKQ